MGTFEALMAGFAVALTPINLMWGLHRRDAWAPRSA